MPIQQLGLHLPVLGWPTIGSHALTLLLGRLGIAVLRCGHTPQTPVPCLGNAWDLHDVNTDFLSS